MKKLTAVKTNSSENRKEYRREYYAMKKVEKSSKKTRKAAENVKHQARRAAQRDKPYQPKASNLKKIAEAAYGAATTAEKFKKVATRAQKIAMGADLTAKDAKEMVVQSTTMLQDQIHTLVSQTAHTDSVVRESRQMTSEGLEKLGTRVTELERAAKDKKVQIGKGLVVPP